MVVSNSGMMLVHSTTGILAPQVIHVNGTSSFSFRIPSTTSGAEISVMDVWGRTVWSHKVTASEREVSWDPASGHSTASGVYVLRLLLMDENHKPGLAVVSKIILAQ